MRIRGIDHLVLTVRDLDSTVSFYSRALGMEVVTFEGGRKALRFGNQKINLHLKGHELEPRALRPAPGSADLCFVLETPLEEAVDHLRANGIEPFLGPVERTGAEGKILSIYLRDPDGNLVELATYPATVRLLSPRSTTRRNLPG